MINDEINQNAKHDERIKKKSWRSTGQCLQKQNKYIYSDSGACWCWLILYEVAVFVFAFLHCDFTETSDVTLVAFFLFVSTVRFQMSSQIACLRGCIVTLVAFVWLFSTVSFLMSTQSAWMIWSKIALVAFVWPLFCHHFSSLYSDIVFIQITIFKIYIHHLYPSSR